MDNTEWGKGFFSIANEMIRDHLSDVQLVYAECVPVHIEFEYHYDRFKVCAYSKHFEKTAQGYFIPEYLPTLSQDESGKTVFKEFKKKGGDAE